MGRVGMLRLERRFPLHEEIAVRFRSREPFITRSLLVGLGVAILLHLLFFLTVQFRGSPPVVLYLHPPVAVEIDLGLPTQGAISSSLLIDRHGLHPRHLSAPEPSHLEHLSLAPEPLTWHSVPETFHLPLGDSFAKAERHSYELFAKKLLLPTRYEPVRVTLSGPLADRTLTSNMISLTEPRVRYGAAEIYCCQFDVNLEEKSGEIFWLALTGSSGYEPLDLRAEQIVRKLHIQGERGGWTTPGGVEVLFEIEEGDPLGLLDEFTRD
jgi:hypothetical protein